MAHVPTPHRVEHPYRYLQRTHRSLAVHHRAPRYRARRPSNHVMDSDEPSSPRMPRVDNLSFLGETGTGTGTVGVVSLGCTTKSAPTRRWMDARRARFIAPVGRLKSRWRSGGGEPEQRPVASTTGRWPGNVERGLIHISTGWDTPRPRTPTPHYRHLFERGRGRPVASPKYPHEVNRMPSCKYPHERGAAVKGGGVRGGG